ncbi:cytochrome P450 [Anabaena azotica FACHB-119]|uniref:Cytochrome P450 n=2 Tax=Anabaena azotica TaxID=197653 RepID=A0ABR8CWP4_9NOST|nr:cytochrome P450 [Anabaena azotica]MBD2499364.1 cytochrome P450 [Anabaena azotica FACHB-119]
MQILPNQLNKPSFIQKLEWVINPVGYLESAAQQHPDIFTAEIIGFGDTLVFVNHPQAIQEILTNDRKKFAALGEHNKIFQPITGNYSVLMLDGDRHRKRRQLVMPSFHGDRMRSYGELIRNITEKAWSQLPTNQVFTAQNIMQDISLQVILQTVFGVHEGERSQELNKRLALMAELFTSPYTSSFLFFTFLQKDLGSWSPWGKFLRDRQQLDELVYEEIAERRAANNPDRIDIFSMLMSSQDEAGHSMTDQELHDELITLLFAGYETTAIAMTWALYLIHQHPQVLEKLLAELDTLGESPDPMSIFRLPYLTAVCNESLRLRPVTLITLPRVVQQPVKVLGHSLEPGTILSGCVYSLHQREDLYPQAKQFQPERFLERQYSPYEFMPFGGGVRRCLGEALAVFEMKLVLATILLNYQLELADNKPEMPCRRGVIFAPARGVRMMITGKRSSKESRIMANMQSYRE